MTVSSATSTTATTTTASSAASTAAAAKKATALSFDPDTFLKLLVTQLQNQDPTSPMKPDEMMSQIATISSVEQVVQTNAKLDQLLTSSALQQADQVIGQNVTSQDGTQTGTVVSVTLGTSGPVAKLADGSTLALGSGITIGGP
jgi:flagellar basal-body rod modification protein FlgD